MARTVTVYIRRGEGKQERTISFQPPREASQSEVLEHDYAFDGQSVTKSLPLTQLLAEQKALIAWLGQHGYEVEFR